MGEIVSHRRIAKNTFALYIRGLISICISLYTSRVIIDTLGVDDYGVYGVAGGFVAMLGFINAAMSGATSRFITYEIGLEEKGRLKQVFANSLTVHIVIAVIILVICEAVGVWFLNNKLNIPEESIVAANWVFQLSIITTMISITQVPYTALVISHEKMGIYAYMELINAVLRLIIVYLLVILPGNKLIIYALLTALVSISIALAYRIYCLKHFKESRTLPSYDKNIVKPILSFSGWDLYGNMCVTARNQGNTFILNIFFGVAINGAASIASVINSYITTFSSNVITAVRPQIVKCYAQQSWSGFQHLIEFGSQVATILLAVMAIPLFIEAPFVFQLWLGDVPGFVVVFCRINLIVAIFAQLSLILGIGIHASGKIKLISLISGTLYILNLPVIYLLLKNGYSPPSAFITFSVFAFLVDISNLYILKRNVCQFSIGKYVGKILSLFIICLPCFLVCWLIHVSLPTSFWRLVLVCLTSVIINVAVGYMIVPSKDQKKQINNKIRSLLSN